MQERITEEEVKNILQNRETIQKSIQDRVLSLYEELAAQEDRLYLLPSTKFMGTIGSGGGSHKDLDDVLTEYRRQVNERKMEIKNIIWQLKEREDTVSRVWACLQALDEPYYTILHALYEEKQLYQAVESSFGESHMSFEKCRKGAIALLIQYYESGQSVADLIRMQQLVGRKQKKKQTHRKEDSEYTQISFLDIVSEESEIPARKTMSD